MEPFAQKWNQMEPNGTVFVKTSDRVKKTGIEKVLKTLLYAGFLVHSAGIKGAGFVIYQRIRINKHEKTRTVTLYQYYRSCVAESKGFEPSKPL